MVIQYDKAEIFQKLRWLKINIIVMSGISLLMVMWAVIWLARSLWREHMKSEALLENTLPKFVIEELEEKKQFVAREISNTSIIFIDIVEFTSFTLSKPPEMVVATLDDLFSIIDALCANYQIEKIKTIGDAHMSVAGLISPQDDHATRAVNMALDVVLAIQHYNLDHRTDFAVKIGIDSGDIVAGIIGKQKFSYDVWGNAVNRASRMEAMGKENMIHISSATYDALINKESYNIIPQTHVTLKGIGEVDTYLVEGRKSAEYVTSEQFYAITKQVEKVNT
jgi:adenylate cyclase